MPDLEKPHRTIERLLFSAGQSDGALAIGGEDGGFTTYGALRWQVRSIAGRLRGAGYNRTDRIALVLPNGPLLASALVAISSSFVCAPLNPGFKEGEFELHLRKLRARAVIVRKRDASPAREVARRMGLEVLEAREAGGVGLFELEGLDGHAAEASFSGEEDDAFLLQTSGTTAIPKLVPLTHANICLTIHYIRNALELTAQDRCLNVTPLFHGFGLISLLITLLSGGSIICASDFSPGRFFKLMDELKPTWYPAVPPVHQSIVGAAEAHRDVVARSRLRFIRSAAARLPPNLMLALEGCFRAPVIEAYGMTEAFAIGSNPLPPRKRKPGSVGLPVGPEVAVMDEKGNFLDNGRVGEIVVRGPNVMRGYEGDEEENARCFVKGWFRTGDLGHIDSEGYIFIDGRVKEVVNRGGEKVTPNEVDDELAKHPAVVEAATFGVPHEVLGEDLVAAVVIRNGSEVSWEDLGRFASGRLASYKVPSRFFFVKEIPKGPSGKVLRRKLQEALCPTKAVVGAAPIGGGREMLPTEPLEEGGIFSEWNATATAYPRQLCIHQIFEGVVARDPSRVAIRHNEIEITYAKLNAKANQLARHLLVEGAGPGQYIGVCMERSPDLVICYLAVLKTGAAYVPIFPPSNSPDRISSYIEDAGIKLVLTKKVYEQLLPEHVKKLYFQNVMDALSGSESGDLPTTINPESPAYLLYVPGPTGIPRGVCVPHRAVSRLVLSTNYVSIGTDDILALQAGPDTNLIMWEIWGTLLNGAKMVVFDMKTILSPRGFARKLREEGVTIVGLGTPFFNLYVGEVPSTFKGVKTLIITGDVVDPEVVRRLENGSPKRLINAYGNTETGGFSTWHLVERAPEGEGPIPIGIPVSNTKVHILDSYLRPVPAGSVGELYIGGEGVALGYLNQPEATKEAFPLDPFHPGRTMYRTGDMVRLNPWGELEYIGRRDRQVKVHGLRVELGEIEAVLNAHPAVRASSVVCVKTGNSAENRLVAYVVPAGSSKPSTEELRESLQRKLLEYMIPSQFVWIDELPFSREGGGAAYWSRAPGVAGDPSKEVLMEGDELERRLLTIWEREMGVKGIGLRDDFFEMGGYSLMAVRIFSRIEEEFGVRLSLATLYRRTTVATMAAELRRGQSRIFRSLVPLRTTGGRPRLFIVHAADGEVYNYGELVKALGDDQPIYGLRAVGLYEDVPLPSSVEEMARDYISEVRAIQPHGPYHIAGWCAGAAIAFEMGRKLSSEGEKVGLVGILDFEEPLVYRRSRRRAARSMLIKEVLFLGGDLLRYARKRALGMRLRILSRVVGIEKLWIRAVGIITADEVILPGDAAPLPDTWRKAILNQLKASRKYKPRRYDGVVTVFKREILPTISSPDPTDGWRRLASGIVAIPIRGRIHGDMLKPPSVAVTAKKIRERIDWHEGRASSARHKSSQSDRLEANPSR